MLSELVDGAFGDDGARLGHDVRACGGVGLLAWLLADPSPEVQMTSLIILGNLCSDSVDAHSRLTKRALLPSARSVISCVYTEDPTILLAASGALQNLTSERDWAELAASHDAHLRLEQLLGHEDARVVRYASGALQNIARSQREALHLSERAKEAIRLRSREHAVEGLAQERARATIARAFARIPEATRRQRMERGRHRRRVVRRTDTESVISSTSTWSYEIGPFVRSRPASACSQASASSRASSHASSYRSAKSSTVWDI